MNAPVRFGVFACALQIWAAAAALHAQTFTLPVTGNDAQAAATAKRAAEAPADVLSSEQWQQVDSAVARSLAWLAAQQKEDGSFPSLDHAQPAVTSLCVLAFMAHGHNPGEGPYGERLEQATEFIISCQKPNGLVALYGPEGMQITRDLAHEIGVAAAYDHAIASLTLSEMYGLGKIRETERLQKVINRALLATLQMQRWPKDVAADYGGWRYVDDTDDNDSDLSVTGWQLMFLRSARNAGFDVPKKAIDDAVIYVRNTFDRDFGSFGYTTQGGNSPSRAMAGAGILALGHAGFHNSFEAQRSGQWLLQYSFEDYNGNGGLPRDRYHYALFTCCQGMYQLGSPYWERFFPRTARTLLNNQQPDGSWDAESNHRDRAFGNSYSTALVLLSLAAPNQLLPVFQR